MTTRRSWRRRRRARTTVLGLGELCRASSSSPWGRTCRAPTARQQKRLAALAKNRFPWRISVPFEACARFLSTAAGRRSPHDGLVGASRARGAGRCGRSGGAVRGPGVWGNVRLDLSGRAGSVLVCERGLRLRRRPAFGDLVRYAYDAVGFNAGRCMSSARGPRSSASRWWRRVAHGDFAQHGRRPARGPRDARMHVHGVGSPDASGSTWWAR